ncbi:MAG: hypothetical protein ETSY2_33260 [Candidatus Entotheonella gemina]|uniref:DUF11 domain-containing protein n=1 Tax=Candidatus Entotheonella gemina TaxID=1429439 RepID=W4M004_9BACT|nr:MAG: hypothetical protein ETSY2_33260 [Candidatus Entotheonella gemina]
MKRLSTLPASCLRLMCSIIIGLVSPAWLYAQLSLNENATLAQIANELEGPGITIFNLSIIVGNTNQYGTFTGGTIPSGAGPVVGIDTGVFLTTGAVNTIAPDRANITPGINDNATLGPNTAGGISFSHPGPPYSDPDLTSIDTQATRDAMIVEFNVVPQQNVLKIAFVFGSDEYPEYVCTIFNDAFGFFVTGDFGSGTDTTRNLAVVPGTSVPIAVNTINNGSVGSAQSPGNAAPCDLSNSGSFIDNGDGTTSSLNQNLQLDGFTIPLLTQTDVIPGNTYRVKLAIADARDKQWDSAVFVNFLTSTLFNDDADLRLSKQADNLAPAVGSNVTFTLTVDNDGPDAAPGVEVTDLLPSGFTYVSDSLGGAAGGPFVDYNPTTGVWTLPSSVASGASATLQITATINASGDYTNIAEITAAQATDPDSEPDNRSLNPNEDDTASITLPPVDLDYGDAPDSYGTDSTDSSGEGVGARHIINSSLYLGAAVPDIDINGFVDGIDDNGNGTDDDATGAPGNGDDEDSITSFPPLSILAAGYTISGIPLHNSTRSTAHLVGWIDFDQSGTFDADEAATVSVPDRTSSVTLTWSSLPGIVAGVTYARFRLTTDTSIATGTAATSVPTGTAIDGEVEDYQLIIGGLTVSGTVYNDANHNRQLDSGETGTGLTLFAKLIPASTPAGPALSAVPVDAGSGAYAFTSVNPLTYRVIIDDNATLSDVTPTLPAGWIGTEIPGQIRPAVTVVNASVPNQNFGLFNGSQLSGTVFIDNGADRGTPNNGLQDGGETGLGSVTVTATDGASTVYDTTTTAADGTYTLYVPAAATTVAVTQTNLSAYLSTGGSPGTTGGTYDRNPDTVSLTATAGTSYSGVDFGDVPNNTFVPDGQQNGLPGTVLWYPHTFTAGSAGTVTFSTSGSSSPAIPGWSETLYQDNNCNSIIDNGEGQIGSIALSAGDQVCILMREAIPHAAPDGATRQVTVSASFSYDNASPSLSHVLQRIDLTTVGDSTSAGLHLLKAVDKTQAAPGEVLTYTITYSNRSNESLSNIVIHDLTPAFTVFQSATCDLPLPLDISGCNVTQQPVINGTGAIEWTLGGTLRPGHQGTVTFSIQIRQ